MTPSLVSVMRPEPITEDIIFAERVLAERLLEYRTNTSPVVLKCLNCDTHRSHRNRQKEAHVNILPKPMRMGKRQKAGEALELIDKAHHLVEKITLILRKSELATMVMNLAEEINLTWLQLTSG